jgi:hypothetical protein
MIKKTLRRMRSLYSYPYFRQCIAGIGKGWFPVFIKYPVYPRPRYGYHGKEPHRLLHQIIDRGRGRYRSQLEACKKHKNSLHRIRTSEPDHAEEPYWSNTWFSGLDAVALYSFLATVKPKVYLEIGSGNSTKFARKSIRDHSLITKIISIDPHPRAEIDALSDEIIRQPLEEASLELFDRLTEGDILFFDGSHRCFMNSDVTVFFLDVLPRLPCGVLIQVHDIHLPYDYPQERALHYESEQYLLAAMLLGGCTKYQIILPNEFVLRDDSLTGVLDGIWRSRDLEIPKQGTSFWFRKIQI